MVDVSRRITLEDFWRWNRVCHTRKIQEKYQKLVQEAQDRNVDVRDVMAERGFENWAAFVDTCERFPLRSRPKDFSELGSGWVLYFYFLRFMMAVMLLYMLAHLPIMLAYLSHDQLDEWKDPFAAAPQVYRRPPDQVEPEPFALTWMARISPGSLGVDGASPAIVPMCYMFGSWLLALMIAFMYALVHKIDEEVDLETTHPNDFAVLVEGLPASAKEDHVIKDFFQRHAVKGRSVEVVKVVIGWNVSQFERTAKQLKKLRDRRRSARIEGKTLPPAEEAQLSKQIEALEAQLDPSGGALELKSAGIAIVVFRRQADQVACLARWSGFSQRWFYKTPTGGWCSDSEPLPMFEVGGRPLYKLKVSRAPNPTDINWRDVGRSNLEYVLRKLASVVVLFLMILGSYLLVVGLTLFSERSRQENPGRGPELSREYVESYFWTSLVPVTAITIINVLLMVAARWFGEREVHLTKTGEAAAITFYMTVAMVLNASFVLWQVKARPPDWFRASGLSSDMYAMLAINFIFPPLMFLMDYELALNWFYRRRLTPAKLQELNGELDLYRGKEDPADKDMFRYVTEKVRSWEVCFEPTIMDLPRHYANAEKTYYCCLIYMALMPLSPFIGFFSILFQYVNDKWMLLRYCRRPSVVQNSEATLEGLTRMRFVLPWFLPLVTVSFLAPCYQDSRGLYAAAAMSLIPGLAVMFVPLGRCAWLFRWAMPSWLRDESVRRGSATDSTTQDYYQAQHLWPKERKYHKTHFLYADLPEEVNPEHLTPESADVRVDVIMRTLRDYKSSRRRHHRRASADERPRSGWASKVVKPDIIGVSEGAAARWEFEAGSGFKAFDEDCQDEVERCYQLYQKGGNPRVKVNSNGLTISVDFKRMTSMVVGSKTVRQIRRS